MLHSTQLELIFVVIQWLNFWLQTLSGSSFSNNLGDWVLVLRQGVHLHGGIVMERTGWESLTGCVGSQVSSETERLRDWQESLDLCDWSSFNLTLGFNFSSLLGQTTVDCTGDIGWAGDFDQEEWLLKSWGTQQLTGVEDSSGGWDDLTATSVDGIWMKGGIHNVDSHASNLFVTKNTVGGDNLETSDHRVLDFVHELTSLSSISDKIWSLIVWTESPDLSGFSLIPVVVIDESSDQQFWLHLVGDLLALNVLTKLVFQWLRHTGKSVVFVSGF